MKILQLIQTLCFQMAVALICLVPLVAVGWVLCSYLWTEYKLHIIVVLAVMFFGGLYGFIEYKVKAKKAAETEVPATSK